MFEKPRKGRPRVAGAFMPRFEVANSPRHVRDAMKFRSFDRGINSPATFMLSLRDDSKNLTGHC
jgi:hypothetical protein